MYILTVINKFVDKHVMNDVVMPDGGHTEVMQDYF